MTPLRFENIEETQLVKNILGPFIDLDNKFDH